MVMLLSEEKLADFLKTGKDWSRLRTSVAGIYVVKLPPYKSAPVRLVVELNPVDETGTPTKRRGLVLRSQSELEEFRKLFGDEKLPKLLGILDLVNPKTEGEKRRKEEGVIEL
jgi:hypothetical protein